MVQSGCEKKAREWGMIQKVNVHCIVMATEHDKSRRKCCSCQRENKSDLVWRQCFHPYKMKYLLHLWHSWHINYWVHYTFPIFSNLLLHAVTILTGKTVMCCMIQALKLHHYCIIIKIHFKNLYTLHQSAVAAAYK